MISVESSHMEISRALREEKMQAALRENSHLIVVPKAGRPYKYLVYYFSVNSKKKKKGSYFRSYKTILIS